MPSATVECMADNALKEMDEYCYLPTEKKNDFDEMNYKIEFSTIRKYEKDTDCNIGELIYTLNKEEF